MATVILVNIGHLGIIALLVAVLPVEGGLPVLVHLQLGDEQAAGRDANIDGGAVGLLASDPLDVDDELLTEAGSDLTLTGLVHAAGDHDLVILADGHGADAVTGLELLREVGRHQSTAGLGVGREVGLARLAPRRRNSSGVLHLCKFWVVASIGKSYITRDVRP